MRTMKRRFLLAACLALSLAGCSSSGKSGSPATSSPTTGATTGGTYATYDSPEAARADMCAIFDRFYSDLTRLGPHGSQASLIQDLGDAHHGIIQAALATNDEQLLGHATDLAGYVGSSDFPTQGNILGAPIQAMQQDCS